MWHLSSRDWRRILPSVRRCAGRIIPLLSIRAGSILPHGATWTTPIERTCFATVAAGLAHAKQSIDTPSSIGSAIARSYKDGNQDDSAKRKLRRLLACDTGTEACQWVRPVLRLAESRGVHVNFGQLLDDLLYFGPKVKERWAIDFYGRKEDKDDSIGA